MAIYERCVNLLCMTFVPCELDMQDLVLLLEKIHETSPVCMSRFLIRV